MNDDDIRRQVLAALRRVAPEVDTGEIAADSQLRDALGLDSMDFLTFVDELFVRTAIDVPERDYPSLTTVDRCVDYLGRRAADALTR